MSAPAVAVDQALVRPMERSDIPGVLGAWEDLMATGRQADPRFRASADPREMYRAYLLDRVFGAFHPFPPAWVAVDGEAVVGWIQGFALPVLPLVDQPPTARIGDMWVHADHRRRGIGTRLVEAFVERANAAGYPWIEVGTLTRDARAVAFWERQGFTGWKVVLLREDAG